MAKLLKQYKVSLERINSFDPIVGDYPDNLGNRTKLGGDPTWIQEDETPICKDCGQKMTFVAQIDSIEHDSEKNPNAFKAGSPEQEYMFGDVGIIYVFYCFECGKTESVTQSY